MTDSDVVERQLALAWRAFTPPAQLREQVRARLDVTGQLGALATGPSAAPSRWRALRASGRLGIALGVGVFALGFSSGLWLMAHTSASSVGSGEPAPSSASVASNAPEPEMARTREGPSVSKAALPVASPSPEPSSTLARDARPAPLGAHRRQTRAAAPRAAQNRDWRGELELLERAERAVRASDSALALSLLAEADARYPHSALGEERSAIELMAQCQARATDAAPRAARFLRAYPSSVYVARISALCPSDAAPTPAEHSLTNPAAPDIQ